jgi:voltage-gated potassium channel
MILTGIALIPWQLGDLIKQLVKTTNQVETLCPTCSLSFHDADAHFCKLCGTKLEKAKAEKLFSVGDAAASNTDSPN